MNTHEHTLNLRRISPLAILLGLILVCSPSSAQDTLRTKERDRTQQRDKTQQQEKVRQQDKIQQQEKTQQQDKTREQEKTQQQVQERVRKNFVDKNADGVDDRLQERRRRRGMTPFVDADGDGIADDRAQGMGFRRGKNMTGSPMDKSSPGGKKYRGGRDQ